MNKNNIKISIITATYNSEKYLEQTIKSVVNQTYKNIEYIIVDGKSTDETLNIINKYKEKISKYISETDFGIYDAFNKGIIMSTGDIILFLNSDDYLYDNYIIENIVRSFVDNPNKNVIYGNIVKINEETHEKRVFGKEITIKHLKKGIMCPHPGMFVKRELFFTYNLFNLNFKIAGDFDIVCKFFKDCYESTLYINYNITGFRLSGISNNPEGQKKCINETRIIIKEHFGFLYYLLYNLRSRLFLFRQFLNKLHLIVF